MDAQSSAASDLSAAAPAARWMIRIVPPVAALACAHLVLSLAAWRSGFDPRIPATWAHWDSWQYLDIAARGYHVAPCAEEPGAFCGNTGWVPGFPYVVRALAALGAPPVIAGVIVALGFSLALLVLVWRRWLDETATVPALLTLLAVALAIGIVYQYAVFPISMVAFFAALQADRLVARRWIAAAAAGAAAAFSYSTAFFLAPVAAGVVLLDTGVPWRRRLVIASAVGLATFCGFAAVLAIQHFEVDAWNAFFLVQARYGHALQSPLTTLVTYFTAPDPGDGSLDMIRLHIIASGSFVILVVAGAVVSTRRGGTALDRWAALYALVFFLVPFAFGTAVNPVRSVSFLSPASIAMRWLPAPVVAIWTALSLWISFEMARLYFANTIV
jgi:hypothetical protein